MTQTGLYPVTRAGEGSVMDRLSSYMAEAAARPLPQEAAEEAAHHLLDTLAAMVSGSDLPPGKAALQYLRAHGARGKATVAGCAYTAAPLEAALANGVMAHADETDDSHAASRSHPGCAIVPAALAAGELFGVSGERLLRAVALGYDVGTRLTMAMGGVVFYGRSSQSTHSLAGVFGAAAAAACAAGLDAQRMRWVLDYTAQQASGITAWRRDRGHIEKAFVFGGMPARNGLASALLVHAGWTGVDDVFSGSDNFFHAYAPDANTELLAEGLGERYEIVRSDIKKWSVGSPIQGVLDALEALRAKRPFEADEVREVTVRLAPTAAKIVDKRDIPDICLQHMAAVMLLDKTVTFHSAHDDSRMHDPETLRQREKITLVHDEALSPFLPTRVAVVELLMEDGGRLTERVEAVRGTRRNPMTRAEVMDKARGLMAPVLGLGRAERLMEAVYALERVPDVRTLQPLLQPE